MSYEFASSLYETEQDWLEAIAISWLSADGWNECKEIREVLDTIPSESLANECLEDWWGRDDMTGIPNTKPERHKLIAVFEQLNRDRSWFE